MCSQTGNLALAKGQTVYLHFNPIRDRTFIILSELANVRMQAVG